MNVSTITDGNHLVLTLSGRLAGDSAGSLDRAWLSPDINRWTVNLGECDYVSSAGLRVFLRMARESKEKGVPLSFVDVLPSVLQVLELTGLSQLLTVQARPREISIDGLEFLSAGVCGECFRLDEETIVKLYNEGVGREVAEQEKAFAKAAFVAGIPTALSYDVVSCGTRTGVMYEMLDATLFSRVIGADPDRVPRYAELLARIAGNLHRTEGNPDVFPALKPRLRGYIDQLRGRLTDGDVDHLQERLRAIPDADTLVHFDLHASNIMIRDGEPLIIDMGDVSRGHPLFDVGVIAMIYGYPETGNCEFVTGLPNDVGHRLYERFLDAYFSHRPRAEREFFERNQSFLASLRLIAAMAFLPNAREALLAKVQDFLMPKIWLESQCHRD
jgi:uncharacterized protein (TIGR02172 family)